MELRLQKGLDATKESRFVEFKTSFDPSNNGEWCELIKDIVAIANTGDGIMFIALNDNGTPSGSDISAVLELDPAVITDKIYRYTKKQYDGVEVVASEKEGNTLAALQISGVLEPMVFERPGDYQDHDGNQKSAFAKGSIYFRHGGKSEPVNNDDLRRVIKRNLDLLRKEMMQGVSKVVKAPLGSTLTIGNSEVSESSSPGAIPIRIVDDPAASGYRILDPDVTHPHRQMDVIRIANERLTIPGRTLNAHDILAVRRTHDIDANDAFSYVSNYGPRQYSDAFIDWVVEQSNQNTVFFQTARHVYHELQWGVRT